MTTNIVMLSCDRPRLLAQAVDSLYAHTDDAAFTLTLIDDGSLESATVQLLSQFTHKDNFIELIARPNVGVTGRMRNLGVYFSEKHFGRGEYLYLSDSDVYFTEGWLDKLTRALEAFEPLKLIGGSTHPFHGTNRELRLMGPPTGWVVRTHDAVSGYSHLMEWSTWDQYGPHDAHAKGIRQSEDWKFCQDIIKCGGEVGTISPEVVYATGITDTNGEPSIGAEQMPRYAGILQQ